MKRSSVSVATWSWDAQIIANNSNNCGHVWESSFLKTPRSGWSFGHPSILSRKLANFGKVEYEALAKTSCRIVIILAILIAKGFRQAGELVSLRVAFGNEKKKCGFSRPDPRPFFTKTHMADLKVIVAGDREGEQ
jgi:hypothetical protein